MSEHELWNELGNLYFMSGAYDQAIHAYTRAISLDAGFGRPYSNLALVYVQKGKYGQAVELYRRSIELLADDREKAVTWNRLGHLHRQLKEYHQAVVAYQQADGLDPESDEDREEPGQAADQPLSFRPPEELPALEAYPEPVASDDVTEAPEASQHGPPLDELLPGPAQPDETPAADWENVSSGLPVEAEPGPDESLPEPAQPDEMPATDWENDSPGPPLEAEPAPFDAGMTEWHPLPDLAASEVAGGTWVLNEDSAVSAEQDGYYFDSVPADSPSEGPAPDATGQESYAAGVAVVQGKPAALLISQAVETAMQAQPAASPPDYAADESSRIELDIARFKRVVQINTRNAFGWDTLGGLYKLAGRYKEAITAYQQAIAIDSAKPFYHYHLGLVYAAEGRTEDAIAAFQKVVELDPGYCLAHATLAGYYRKMGLEELAQRHIEKALSDFIVEENEYNHACLQAICGNVDRAIELLEIALKNKQTIIDWVRRDPDLDFIRGDERFQALVASYTSEGTQQAL